MVTSLDPLYRTTLGAQFGKPPDKNRRTDWDDRRAVVFLEDYSKISELGWQEGRYWMGEATDIQEFYSMGSVFTRPWIPAVSEDPNEERFLLRDDKYQSRQDCLARRPEGRRSADRGQTGQQV